MPLIGNVDKITRSYVAGWLADSDQPGQPVDVLVYVNGQGRGRVTANQSRDDLRMAFPGATGNHAFRFEFGQPLSPFRSYDVSIIDARERRPLPGGERILPVLGSRSATAPAPICVTSTGRAGTSLLMGRLAAHPEIAVAGTHPYEIKQLTYQVLALRTLTVPANWNRSMKPEELLSDTSRYLLGFNPYHDPDFGNHSLLDRYWDVTAPELLKTAFRDTLLAYYDTVRAMTGKAHVQYFAEKTHPNPVIRDGAIAMFGAVKEIVLVRDPRDLVCSYRAFWGPKTAEVMALIRSQLSELTDRVREAATDALLLKYEDLVLQPAESIGRVWAFLGLEHGQAERHEAEVAIFRKHGTSDSPEKSIGRWRRDLTAEERQQCEAAFSEHLTLLGYHPGEVAS
ncbi:MAG: sulfotransferase [Acidimicrobiales bacterium]